MPSPKKQKIALPPTSLRGSSNTRQLSPYNNGGSPRRYSTIYNRTNIRHSAFNGERLFIDKPTEFVQTTRNSYNKGIQRTEDSVNSPMTMSQCSSPSRRSNSSKNRTPTQQSSSSSQHGSMQGSNQESSEGKEKGLVLTINEQTPEIQREICKSITRNKLFPLVKFISNIHTDKRLRFSREPNTVCGIVLRASGASLVENNDGFLIPWWEMKVKSLKIELTAHRNNIIKTIKKKYVGKQEVLLMHSNTLDLT